jgi:hypothetical protein
VGAREIILEIARLERRRRRTGFGDGRKRQELSHRIVVLRRLVAEVAGDRS